MAKFASIKGWIWGCAGMCLVLGGACSSDDDDDDGDGRSGSGGGGTAGVGAVGGLAGRPGGGRPGGGSAGMGGAGEGGLAGGGMGGAGRGGEGGSCDEEVVNGLIQRTLSAYCADHFCPATIQAARDDVTRDCDEVIVSEETTGCGRTVVSLDAGLFGRGFVFEGNALVGAYSFDDVTEPPCDTQGEVGGLYPPACSDTETCLHCDNEDGSGGVGPFCPGAGGAGGQGGQGGQGGNP